jgi:hypothetical protein
MVSGIASLHDRRANGCLVAACLLVAALAGCACVSYNPPPSSDTSAANLDVQMLVMKNGQELSAGHITDSLSVTIYFALGAQHGVQFNQGETVTCGSTQLTFVLGSYRATLTGWTAPLTCMYTRNGTSTSITAPLPSIPLPTYPTVGTTVPRSTALQITYPPVAGSLGVRIRHDPNTAPDSAFQPDTGTIIYDASQESPGSGTLTVERRTKTAPGNSGFKSLSTVTDSDASILIVWA